MSHSSLNSASKPIVRAQPIKRQPAPPKPVIKFKERVVIKSTEK